MNKIENLLKNNIKMDMKKIYLKHNQDHFASLAQW